MEKQRLEKDREGEVETGEKDRGGEIEREGREIARVCVPLVH